MKKIIKIAVVLILVAVIGIPLLHNYGDDVFELIAFSKQKVVQLDSNTYICSKDEWNNFGEELESQGWTLYDQMGAKFIYEKDREKREFFMEIHTFCTTWKEVEN